MIRDLLLYLYRHQRLLLTITIAATASILLLTLLPTEKIANSGLFQYDKIGHMVVFGGWTFLFGLVRLSYTHASPSYLGMEFMAGLGFGVGIELLQHFLPVNRSADFFDLLADLVGIILAVYFLRQTHRQLEEDQPATTQTG